MSRKKRCVGNCGTYGTPLSDVNFPTLSENTVYSIEISLYGYGVGSASGKIDTSLTTTATDGQLEFSANATPLPAALPLFATGLAGLGLLGWRRKRKNAAAILAA